MTIHMTLNLKMEFCGVYWCMQAHIYELGSRNYVRSKMAMARIFAFLYS